MFLNEQGKVIYVGKAQNIKKRVSSYFLNKDLGPKTTLLVSKIKSIKTISVESELEALLLEAYLIKKYLPIYNIRLTDGKSYPYVFIDSKAKFPNLQIIRRPKNEINVFGPFPNSTDLRYVLKLIRRIFPYQSVISHPKKKCLYNHLELCPCPPLLTDADLKEYRRNIGHLVKFLKGDTKGLLNDLEKERDEMSKNEDFEGAFVVQQKIEKIRKITTSFTRPFNYDINPNLKDDLAQKSLEDLQTLLKENGVEVSSLNRIECFDISNTSGQEAVGSLVVFTNGVKDSSSYKRFKIKKLPKVIPNDFAMMAEVLERRIKRDDWPKPDLIVVDGGKGQVSAVKKILVLYENNVPMIGLAKREETIITPEMNEIRVKKSTDAYRLITAIRNEAHRFAITYHKKLRSKMVFEK